MFSLSTPSVNYGVKYVQNTYLFLLQPFCDENIYREGGKIR